MSSFDACFVENDGDVDTTLQCVSTRLEAQMEANNSSAETEVITWLLIFAGGLVFFMQAGFAMVCAGAVRRKNSSNAMLKNLLDACGTALAYYVCGFGLSFGATDDRLTFAGNTNFFLHGEIDHGFFFFQCAFSAAAVTIVASTLAERCKMISYLCYSMILGGFVYPITAHFIWSGNGYLSCGINKPFLGSGVIDFAGSGVVHMTGGTAALCASVIVGPRRGRFYDEQGQPLSRLGLQKGHSESLQMLGTMILWFGWYGFNPGSALLLDVPNRAQIAALAAVNTTLAAASGGIVALLSNGLYLEYTKKSFYLDISKAMNGCLAGLVAITAPCATVTEGWAIAIGAVAGLIYLGSAALLISMKIDDAVDAIPVHFFNGLWGLLAVGLMSNPKLVEEVTGIKDNPGWFFNIESPMLFFSQLMGALFIMLWTCLIMIPFFKLLEYFDVLRVDLIDEIVGLDAHYHGDELPQKLFDEESDETDDELRLKAYQMRFAGKRNKKNVSVEEVLEASWGNFGDFESSAPSAHQNKTTISEDHSKPETIEQSKPETAEQNRPETEKSKPKRRVMRKGESQC